MRDPFGASGGMQYPRSAIKQMAKPLVRGMQAYADRLSAQVVHHAEPRGQQGGYQSRQSLSVSDVLPHANPNLTRGLRLVADPNMKGPADTRGSGANTVIYYNPNQPRSGLAGVLAHELVHVAQRRSLGGSLLPWAQLAGAGVDRLRGADMGTTFRDFTEPPAYYLGGNGNERTSASQVSPWLRPFYSRVLR